MLAASMIAALCLLAMAYTSEAYKQGLGTAYSGPYDKDATGFNSCQFGKLEDRWERFYCAIPSKQFDRERDCGKCIRARGLEEGASGKWVKCKLVDECGSGCGENHVDFSTTALEAVTGFSWDRKKIEWEFTECEGDDDDEWEEDSSNNDDDEDDDNKNDDNDDNDDDDDDNNNDDDDDDEDEDEDRRRSRRMLRKL